MATTAKTTSGRLLSPLEVAQRLGVSRVTVYRMVHDGRLPAAKLGRHSAGLRIRAEDVEAWLWSEGEPDAAS
jgi:excisionase family DNA binding protein